MPCLFYEDDGFIIGRDVFVLEVCLEADPKTRVVQVLSQNQPNRIKLEYP